MFSSIPTGKVVLGFYCSTCAQMKELTGLTRFDFEDGMVATCAECKKEISTAFLAAEK